MYQLAQCYCQRAQGVKASSPDWYPSGPCSLMNRNRRVDATRRRRLILLGAVVLAARGISYTKDRDFTNIGPFQVSTVKKGFVPPVVGVITPLAGVVLEVAGRGKPA